MAGDQNNKLTLSPIRIANGGFPGGSMVKHVPANAGDKGSISGLGRPTGKVNGNLLQYSCLEKSHGQRTCWATVHGVARESGTTQKLNNTTKIVDTS